MSQTATKKALGEVRLKVAYKKPEALLSEYTRSVGQGGVTLQVQKSLPLGTRFVFEMHNPGVAVPVEVVGEVVRVTSQPDGRYMITVKYDAGMDRGGLDAVLQRIFDLQAFEKLRRYPRIPLRLLATEEETPFAPPYFVKDLSRGGVGLEVEMPGLPASVKVGMPFMLEMELTLGTLMLHGEVAWTSSGGAEVLPTFGVTFGTLGPDTVERLEKLLSLESLPPAPWRARICFGMDAVMKMP
ncbi:MAG TPA: PilZ domain-containing protein [Archangium sp.]|uniref:PilZ domain-containing protein n=1 Tax=Archangium sp. TaxID=1872627 RepID=UPI002ED8B4B1